MFNQYILIIIWIGFMALLQGNFYREEYSGMTGGYEWRVKRIFAFMVILPVIIMAGNRGWILDTILYISTYQSMPESFSGIMPYLSTVTKDKGFYFISAVMKVVFDGSYVPYLYAIAIFQGFAVVKVFRKNTSSFVFSIFLFIASTDYISWMFNGIRQFMAVAIILLSVPIVLNAKDSGRYAKWIMFIIIVVIASTMHQSAVLMLPFVFIAQGEAWNKKTILYIVLVLLAIIFVGRFTNILNDALSTTQYANVVNDYTEWNDDGTNPFRVLVYSIPAVFSFFGRKKIQTNKGVMINFCTNMSIISAGIYLLSMVTSGIFIGRLPIYCSLFSYILLPWEIENLFDYGSKKLIKVSAVIAYLLFYYYQMHTIWGLM